jgi:Mg-chelatase subunit ChlD
MFDRPQMLWLLLALPLIVAPGVLAIRAGNQLKGALATAIRLAGFVALVLALAGLETPLRSGASQMALVVAIDQSRSIAPDQRAWMMRQLARISRAMNPRDRMAVIGFGRDSRLISPLGDPRLATGEGPAADPNATDIAGALTTAQGVFPAGDEKRLLILSDGDETTGHALDELPGAAQQGIRIFTMAPPPPAAARIALTDFQAPEAVRADTSFALHLGIENEAARTVSARVKLSGAGTTLGSQQLTLAPGMNRFEMPYRVGRTGAWLMKAEISVPPPIVAANPVAETALSVIPAPRVLVIATSPPESLINALKLRHYDVESTAPRGLPMHARDYLAYQAVVIANVAAESLDENVQEALNRYVADYGGGLVVTGDSLRDYKFHGSPLEKTLPINFQAQPPPPSREPVAVYLLIDRSNSMSYNSRYPAVRDGERIRYAKQAAIALLNQLDDTDYAGVIAFDSEPYVLSPLHPLSEGRGELESRVARLEPGGGTDFLDALQIAEKQILAANIPVREVILLTDGDTNRQYSDHTQLMADFAKQRIPVSTIRIGPDLDNLRLLQDFAGATGGVFYRVEDITKLPQLLVHLTHEAQNYKRHEHARIDQESPSSVLNGIGAGDIPPIDFFALTQSKDGSEIPLMVRQGPVSAPLVATWQYELGRSAIFAADPDSMGSLAWIRWNRYAEFWSQLTSWVSREGDSGPFSLHLRDSADGSLEIEAQKVDQVPVSNLYCRITGPGRALDVAMTQVGGALYHGESSPLARGTYNLTLMLKAGDTENVLLRREVAVLGPDAADSDEMRLRPPNFPLLRQLAQVTGGEFDAPIRRILMPRGATVTTYRSLNSLLLPLAMLLLLADVFVRRRLFVE